MRPSVIRSCLAVGFVFVAACAAKEREAPQTSQSAAPAPSTSAAPVTGTPVAATPTSPSAAAPSEPAAPAAADTLEMTFVGDIIFGRYRESGYDPIPEGDFAVFGEIATQLASDVLVGNLETPLVRTLPPKSPIGSRFSFGAAAEHAEHLRTAGFAAVSLANNHWFDQRAVGIDETPPILRELGIVPLGGAVREGPVFRVETVEKNGWRLGFVAITTRTNAPLREGMPVLPYLTTGEIKATVGPVVEAARADHDLVIVAVHWGDEYADAPSLSQTRAAHALVDAGADLVIGHHPHVLQGVERYGKGLIAYSLGNFLFENTNAIPRLTGVLRVKARRDGRCLERVVLHPAYIKRMPVQHPVPAQGGLGRQVRDRATGLSKRLGTEWIVEGEDLVLRDPTCG